MFDVSGDEISYRGVHFATINGKAWPTLRASAETAIVSSLTEDEVADEINKAREEGKEEGREAAASECAENLNRLADSLGEVRRADDIDDMRDALEDFAGQLAATIREINKP